MAFVALVRVRLSSPDVLVIAGDLFDNPAVSSEIVQFAADRLSAAVCADVILPGNHDLTGPGLVYERFDSAHPADYVHSGSDGWDYEALGDPDRLRPVDAAHVPAR